MINNCKAIVSIRKGFTSIRIFDIIKGRGRLNHYRNSTNIEQDYGRQSELIFNLCNFFWYRGLQKDKLRFETIIEEGGQDEISNEKEKAERI